MDGNGHRSKNNINHFTPLYKSDDEKGTKHRTKPNTPIILKSGKEKGRTNKGGQNKSSKKDGNSRENNITAKVYDLNSDEDLNGDFGIVDNDDNSDTNDKEHIYRGKVLSMKNSNKNKKSSLTVKETSLMATCAKETNKEEKCETMDTSYNK